MERKSARCLADYSAVSPQVGNIIYPRRRGVRPCYYIFPAISGKLAIFHFALHVLLFFKLDDKSIAEKEAYMKSF
jgi:hypothetical protein